MKNTFKLKFSNSDIVAIVLGSVGYCLVFSTLGLWAGIGILSVIISYGLLSPKESYSIDGS